MPKLSIITVNLNNHKGLLKTIDSVITQTLSDFEYIVVDGASTDGSVEIIKKNSHQISKWLSETDSGVYQAMNKGIRMATGEYLLFLNSGDFLVSNLVLESVFNQERTADILCGKCNISDNGIVVHTTNPPENITFGTLFYTGLAHQSTFIRKDLFKTCGFYREDFKYNSDIDFWYKSIILNAASTAKVDSIICNYNLEGMSSADNKTQDFMDEHEKILSNPIFQKIIPDYVNWKAHENEMKIFYWIQNKKLLLFPIKLSFRLSKYINLISKKYFKDRLKAL